MIGFSESIKKNEVEKVLPLKVFPIFPIHVVGTGRQTFKVL